MCGITPEEAKKQDEQYIRSIVQDEIKKSMRDIISNVLNVISRNARKSYDKRDV